MADQEWQFQDFVAPNGAGAAANFLNAPARQGRGEASGSVREIGTAGLLWLEPGSLGNAAQPAWEVVEYPGPNGEADVVAFLNAPPRQARGEATASLRDDGTAAVIYLEPGSLGNSTAQTWQYKNFVGPNGVQAALAFLNASPRQAAGEATGYVRDDGSALVFYLEPGTGG